MTEPVEGTEAAQTTEDTAGKRGRPRPTEVMERDEKVFEAVVGPMTKAQVAEATGLQPSLVYLSLLRLRVAGRLKHVRSGTGHVWARPEQEVPGETVAAEAPTEG